jgi:SAM-dependent methyltransferase
MGNGFQVGNNICRVLEYSSNDMGWSDDLTSLHEDAAGSDHFIDRASRRHALQQLLKYAGEKPPVVLEIGCSSGFLVRQISERLKDSVVIGSDIVHKPLEQLASSRPDLPLFRFDLVRCPFPDSSIDAVIMVNVLEHIENDRLAMQQVYRILKPGGIAVIEAPAGPHLYDFYDKSLMHFRRYTMMGLTALVEGLNFRVLERSHLGFFLYPGFSWVKRRNKKLVLQSEDIQKHLTERNIRKTGASRLLDMLIQFELAMGKFISYPVGIRCLVTCIKPAV